MGDLARGILVLTICGWAIRPALRPALGGLPDGGGAVCRILGTLAATWVAFLVAQIQGGPLTARVAWAAVGAIALGARLAVRLAVGGGRVSAAAVASRSLSPPPRRAAMVTGEVLFVAGAVLFYAIVAHNPAIDPDSERMMDWAFLKAWLRSPGLPVADPWFAGRPVNYYDFGYAVTAFLVRATVSDPGRLLVPVIALIHALTWGVAFEAGLALTGKVRGGLLAAFMVLGAGNFAWIRTLAAGRGVFDWFAASRIIPGAITEFPWFSLLWGDLHPYVMALPVFLAALLLMLSPAPEGRFFRGARLGAIALAVGALAAIHPWDVPILFLAGIALAQRVGGGRRLRAAAGLAGALLAGTLLFLPYLQGIDQGGRSIALVTARTAPADWFLAFGPFVILAAAGAIFLRPLCVAPPGGAPGGEPVANGGRRAMILAAAGLAAALVCEIVYLRDIFATTEMARMNTVFKLHRLAWALFALSSAWLSVRLLCLPGRLRLPGRAAVVVALAGAAVYPILGTVSWLEYRRAIAERGGDPAAVAAAAPGAGAEDLFRVLFPGDAAVTGLVARLASPGEAVLEESGDPYTWSGRIATFSGVPAVLGWANHEAGWRNDWGEALARREQIARIYRDPSSPEAAALLRRHGVAWVVVGERERARYGLDGPAGFDRVGRKIVEVDGTVLYRIDR